jgi:hypothetical protein
LQATNQEHAIWPKGFMGCGRRPLTVIGGLTMSDNEQSTEFLITSLLNAIYYFIEIVYILKLETGHYRLVAIHHGHVLTDLEYGTIRGAKIAFSKLYRHKPWQKGVRAEWTPFYKPEKKWIDRNIPIKMEEEKEEKE